MFPKFGDLFPLVQPARGFQMARGPALAARYGGCTPNTAATNILIGPSGGRVDVYHVFLALFSNNVSSWCNRYFLKGYEISQREQRSLPVIMDHDLCWMDLICIKLRSSQPAVPYRVAGSPAVYRK